MRIGVTQKSTIRMKNGNKYTIKFSKPSKDDKEKNSNKKMQK